MTHDEWDRRRWEHAREVARYGWRAGSENIRRMVEIVEVSMTECVETGERFATRREAAAKFGVTAAAVGNALAEQRPLKNPRVHFRLVRVKEFRGPLSSGGAAGCKQE